MENLQPKVKEVREKFLSKYNGNILDDTYDERDVEWVKKNDTIIRCSLAAYKSSGDVIKAVDLLNEMLLFRAKFKLNDVKLSDLDAEIVSLGGVFFHGKDKNGHKVLHFRVSKQKSGYKIKEGKLFIAYHLNKHFIESPEDQIVPLFDMSDAGVSNMDMDTSKFIIACLGVYFPNIGAYSIMFKMGFALEAIWTIIKGFLDPDQSKRTFFASRKNIQEYIASDQLLPHMIKTDK